MGEIVERVARMIDPDAWGVERDNVITGVIVYDDGREPTVTMGREDYSKRRDAALSKAKQVIAAMREPTSDMHRAGMIKREEGTMIAGAKWGEPTTDEIWHAMIDAALK